MAALDDLIAQYFRKRGLKKTLSAFAEESQFKDCKKVEEDLENIYSSYLSNKGREVADTAEKPSSMRKAKKESADTVIANGESDGTEKETKKKGRKVKNIEKKSSEEKIESEPVDVVTSDVAVETVVAGDRTEPDAPTIQEAVDEPPLSKKKKGKKAKSETDSDKMDVDDEKKKISADESGALEQEPPSKQKKGKKADKSKGKEPVEITEGDHGTVEMEVDAKKGSEAEGLLDASNESSKKRKKKGRDSEAKAEVETGNNVAVEQVADANSKKKKGKKEKTEPANGKDLVDSTEAKAETKLEAGSEINHNDNSEQEVSKKKKGKKNSEKGTKEHVKEADGNPVAEAAEKSGQKRKRKNKEEEEEAAEGDGKTAAKAFQRVKPDEVEFLDPRLQDNSYWAKDGAEVGWGAKAQEVLGQVKGRGFRHEKTKKKRGSYKGGVIDLQSHSIKFDNDDSSS